MNAAGTFDWIENTSAFFKYNKLGALITKTITYQPHKGNPPPRIIETPAGMLNSIGLENPGLEKFIKYKLPQLKKLNTKIIVSIGGKNIEEYVKLATILNSTLGVDALEVNISCPNFASKIFAQDAKLTYKVITQIRKKTSLPLIVKLSPNVTDITSIAVSAEKAGANAVSLVNTFLALAINIKTRKPYLKNIFGGLSGPAIKPIALRMVWEVTCKIKIPVIGIGGITNANDAIEFLLAGAKAVAIGTANFIQPKIMWEIISGIKKYLETYKINDINKLKIN